MIIGITVEFLPQDEDSAIPLLTLYSPILGIKHLESA